jgi:hypothetical protein
MRAAMPNFPCEFEIPDEWWVAAGMAGFAASQPAYRSAAGAKLVSLREIEPPHLDPANPRDWCGFDRFRMLRILSGLKDGVEMRPVPLLELAVDEVPSSKSYAYRPLDGYHRFYASIAAGFQFLPASVIR